MVGRLDSTENRAKLTTLLEAHITNPAERSLVRRTLLIVGVLTAAVLALTLISLVLPAWTPYVSRLDRPAAALSRPGTIFAVLVLPAVALVKYLPPAVRSRLVNASRTLRKWHVPVALSTTGLGIIHSALALRSDSALNAANVSGLLLLPVMGVLISTGLLRYRRLDRRWHLVLGLGMLVLLYVHGGLAEGPHH